jgi:hypothetical protein
MRGKFRSRKKQIEKDLLQRLIRELQFADCRITVDGVTQLESFLKSAAMIGACAERDRTLAIIRANAHGCSFNRDVSNEIISKGVLDVLGYDESSESTAASSPSRGTRRRKIPPRTKDAQSPFARNR